VPPNPLDASVAEPVRVDDDSPPRLDLDASGVFGCFGRSAYVPLERVGTADQLARFLFSTSIMRFS
jgi:hypothetical protein